MRDQVLGRSRSIRVLSCSVQLLATVLLVGCATALPPAKPIGDFKSIAGTWAGSAIMPQSATVQFTATINPDGTFVQQWPRAVVTGTLDMVAGQVRYKDSNHAGTVTLHEGDGKRILRWVRDGGEFSFEMTPTR